MYNTQTQIVVPSSTLQISWSKWGFSFKWKRDYVQNESVNNSSDPGKDEDVEKARERSEILIDWI